MPVTFALFTGLVKSLAATLYINYLDGICLHIKVHKGVTDVH